MHDALGPWPQGKRRPRGAGASRLLGNQVQAPMGCPHLSLGLPRMIDTWGLLSAGGTSAQEDWSPVQRWMPQSCR